MPLHPIPLRPRHSYPALVTEIANELRKPASSAAPGIPDIYEEQVQGGYLKVTVIWDRWDGVPREQRGAIILDAYEEAGRKADVPRITLVLGLTADEATRLGIDYK